MEALKGIPLRDQGEPLPEDFPYKGQWLHKPLLFLHRPIGQASLGGAEITAVAQFEGNICAGISSMQLAFLLRVSSEDIFVHNAANTLFLVRTDEIPPSVGGTQAKQYVFQIGERQAPMIIEGGGPNGNA
jgi:hypothetical protein